MTRKAGLRTLRFGMVAFLAVMLSLASCIAGSEDLAKDLVSLRSSAGAQMSTGTSSSAFAELPGARTVTLKVDQDLKLKVDAELKLKVGSELKLKLKLDSSLKLKSPLRMMAQAGLKRFLAPGDGVTNWFVIAVTPYGNVYRSQISGSNYALSLPTNMIYALFLERSGDAFTNLKIIYLPDEATSFEMTSGVGGVMSAIDLGSLVYSNKRLVVSQTPLLFVDRDHDDVPDEADDAALPNTIDKKNDGVVDFYGLVLEQMPSLVYQTNQLPASGTNRVPDLFATATVTAVTNEALATNALQQYYSTLLALDDGLSLYRGTPIASNAAVQTALDLNLTNFSEFYAQGWTNNRVQVTLSTQYTALANPVIASNLQEARAEIALDPGYVAALSNVSPHLVSVWSNTLVTVALDTNFAALLESTLSNLLAQWSNSVAAVALNTNLSALVTNPANTNLATAWSNTLAEVLLAPGYTNIVASNWLDEASNGYTVLTNNPAVVSNYVTNNAGFVFWSTNVTRWTNMLATVFVDVSYARQDGSNITISNLLDLREILTETAVFTNFFLRTAVTNRFDWTNAIATTNIELAVWTTNSMVQTNALPGELVSATAFTWNASNFSVIQMRWPYAEWTLTNFASNLLVMQVVSNAVRWTNFSSTTNLSGVNWTTNRVLSTNYDGLLHTGNGSFPLNDSNFVFTNYQSNWNITCISNYAVNFTVLQAVTNAWLEVIGQLSETNLESVNWTTGVTNITNVQTEVALGVWFTNVASTNYVVTNLATPSVVTNLTNRSVNGRVLEAFTNVSWFSNFRATTNVTGAYSTNYLVFTNSLLPLTNSVAPFSLNATNFQEFTILLPFQQLTVTNRYFNAALTASITNALGWTNTNVVTNVLGVYWTTNFLSSTNFTEILLSILDFPENATNFRVSNFATNAEVELVSNYLVNSVIQMADTNTNWFTNGWFDVTNIVSVNWITNIIVNTNFTEIFLVSSVFTQNETNFAVSNFATNIAATNVTNTFINNVLQTTETNWTLGTNGFFSLTNWYGVNWVTNVTVTTNLSEFFLGTNAFTENATNYVVSNFATNIAETNVSNFLVNAVLQYADSNGQITTNGYFSGTNWYSYNEITNVTVTTNLSQVLCSNGSFALNSSNFAVSNYGTNLAITNISNFSINGWTRQEISNGRWVTNSPFAVTNFSGYVAFTGSIVYVSTGGDDAYPGYSGFPKMSLQAALAAALQNGVTNIRVQGGTYTPGAGLNNSGSGAVISNTNLCISGNWDAAFVVQNETTVLDGNNTLYHVLSVLGSSNVRLESMILTRGNANGTEYDLNGGGIYVSNAPWTRITNCSITDNTAKKNGGGIYVTNSDYFRFYGTVSNNIAGDAGGGVAILASGYGIIDMQVLTNIATNYGGGIYNYIGTSNTLSGLIAWNRAISSGGGGIYDFAGERTVVKAEIFTNTAGTWGGGIINVGCDYVRYTGNVIGNIAGSGNGGGIALQAANNYISGTNSGNIAGGYGGGLYINQLGSNAVECVIVSNSADNGGGVAIENIGDIVLRNSVILDNRSVANDNSVYLWNGGGLNNFVLSNCVIGGTNGSGNYAIYEAGTTALSGHTMKDNIFDASRLAFLYKDVPGTTFANILWMNNPAKTGAVTASGNRLTNTGGIVYVDAAGQPGNWGVKSGSPLPMLQGGVDMAAQNGITNVRVKSGTYYRGAGLSPDGTNGVIVTNNNLYISGGWDAPYGAQSGATVLDGGNGVFHVVSVSNTTNVRMDGFAVRGGKATGMGEEANGGGFYLNKVTRLIVSNCVISNNTATNGGGMYLCNNSVTNYIDCQIISNTAGCYGGGLFATNNGNTNDIRGSFTMNYAYSGGGFHICGDKYKLDTTVSNNKSGQQGGGFSLVSSSYNTINATICNNNSGYGGGFYIYNGSYNNLNINVYSNKGGSGGGFFLNSANNNTINGTCYSNTGSIGAGFGMQYSGNNTFNLPVYLNVSSYNGGGINIFNCYPGNIFNSSIYSNTAVNSGGAVSYSSGGNNDIFKGIVFGNSAVIGGGFHIVASKKIVITGIVTGNSATSLGGGIFLTNSDSVVLTNLIITNNYSTGINSVIHLVNNGAITNLTISNCTIGGNNTTTSYGIYESGSVDTTNHVLMANTFVTNKLRYLYHDLTGGDAANDASWSQVNNISFTGATNGSIDNTYQP